LTSRSSRPAALPAAVPASLARSYFIDEPLPADFVPRPGTRCRSRGSNTARGRGSTAAITLAGLPATGKSTLAACLAEALSGVVLCKYLRAGGQWPGRGGSAHLRPSGGVPGDSPGGGHDAMVPW